MAKKAKPSKNQNKGKGSLSHHPGPGRNQPKFEFRDMTAERQYNLQLSQAQNLYSQEEFDEVIALLEPLRHKFPDRLPRVLAT